MARVHVSKLLWVPMIIQHGSLQERLATRSAVAFASMSLTIVGIVIIVELDS